MRQFTTDDKLQKYPTKFLKMCQSSVLNNKKLEIDFRLVVGSLVISESAGDASVVYSMYKDPVSKLANTRVNEHLNAKSKRDLQATDNVVDANKMLRPKVKFYALASSRKTSK